MGHVRVKIKLSNPERADGAVEIPDALVDTGATWTAVPRAVADALGLRRVGSIALRTAGGPQTLEQSYAHIEMEGKTMVTPLVISDLLDQVLIGVTTLESMGFAVDPGTGRLKESEVYLL